jgi:hypothetical protein
MINVERSEFDPKDGRCQYYVLLKPNVSKEEVEVHMRVPVEVGISVSETGDLADLSFVVPKKYRTDHALSFLKAHRESASYVDPRVFISIPGNNGDSVLSVAANLEVDASGRIVGLDIH